VILLLGPIMAKILHCPNEAENSRMRTTLGDYFRVPLNLNGFSPRETGKSGTGFFHFGKDIVCYGECAAGVASDVSTSLQFDALQSVKLNNSEVCLPFDAGDVIENLRRERYASHLQKSATPIAQRQFVRQAYYLVRELLPVGIRRHLQRAYFRGWEDLPFPHWPVDFTVDRLHEELLRLTMDSIGCQRMPFIWFWPDGASGCLLLTHDVETAAGRDFCSTLMGMDQSHGFSASFQVVPEKRYEVPDDFVNEIRNRGFELNIHDLTHDGQLFGKRSEFLRRAEKINEYAKKYHASGFRAGAMYRNLDWFDAFEFSYDMSVPNVAHLEPQRGGCCTVMPFFVGKILEIPLTATQDYSVFNILNTYSISLWKRQIELIHRRNGLLSFITHPDYLIRPQARKAYESLLVHLREIVDRDSIWATVPGELDRWWRARNEMKLIQDGNDLRIVGDQSKRARVAYATLDAGRMVYTVERNSPRAA